MNLYDDGKMDFDSLGEVGEKLHFIRINDEVNSFLQFLKSIYFYMGPIIEFEFLNSLKMVAYAVESDSSATIKISRGMVQHCLQKYGELEQETINRFSTLGVLGAKIAASSLLWVIAHEFFHIARGHQELRRRDPAKYNQPTEYDADCFSAAGLYRYLQRQFSPLVEFGLKVICLRAFYRAMRPVIGTGKIVKTYARPHPDMYLRLRYVIYKLGALDAPLPNYGLTQTWSDKFGLLIDEYIKAEKEYLECVGVGDRKSEFIKITRENMGEGNGDPLAELVRKWESVEGNVLAASRLLLDMVQSGKGIFMAHPMHGSIFLKDGWRYASGTITGFFAPRFHLKKGAKGDSNDYSVEKTIVTPIWVAGHRAPW